ncbi:MAG: hypothetical protein JNK75_05460 [Betaproteobacteria bacterium]|nr:hypothetical protein [Betaproteobacteria bacterium]
MSARRSVLKYAALALAFAMTLAQAVAAPPATINYQGTLTNASAQPVNSGAVAITFSLYTAASGGSAIYSETQAVSVTNGLFNVRIGAVSPIALPFDVPYFLGITVGGDAEMVPRQPLGSSAYAFRAFSADAVATGAVLPAGQVAGSLANATIPAANVVGGGGAGTVTNVATGAGLSGGPITASGTINLAVTNLLPTTACATNQIPKWNGSAWACGTDADTNSGGTVTSVATGAGLTGGPITGSGTIGLAATSLLPTSPCAPGQVPKWNGTDWACASDALPVGATVGSVLARGVSGIDWYRNLVLDGELYVTNFVSIDHGMLLNDTGKRVFAVSGGPDVSSVFAGADAGGALAAAWGSLRNAGFGNLALGSISAATSVENAALGATALRNATGSRNIGIGFFGGGNLTTGDDNIAIGHAGVAGESATMRLGSAQTRTFMAGIRGVTPPGGSPLPVVIDANGQLGTGAAGGGGTVTNVATGAGLTGGPITATGTINLAATNLLPTTACAMNQITKWNGSAWACAADDVGTGDITGVTVGAGLSGGATSGSAAINLAATNLLPTSACATAQVPIWTGSAWACTGDVALTGSLFFPLPTATTGVLSIGGNRYLHAYGNTSAFFGRNAGNFMMTGTDNVGIGTSALTAVTSGASNVAVGATALDSNTTGTSNVAIGASAMSANASGTESVAVGRNALAASVGATGNTGLGHSALQFNSTGTQNTAVGRNAQAFGTTGSFNTALGHGALSQVTGDSNIAIGVNSGTAITSGGNNIVIGNTGVAGESDTIRIGRISHFSTYINGIRTAEVSGGQPVYIDSQHQLGVGQTGMASVGTGAAGVNVFTITFPTAFTFPPKVLVTPRFDLFGGGEVNDTVVATVRAISTTQFKVNVYRVDIAGGSWSANLNLVWQAWR